MSENSEYNLGYFEGVRNISLLYTNCLMRIVNHQEKTMELRLDSEAFVSLLSEELEAARDANDLRL